MIEEETPFEYVALNAAPALALTLPACSRATLRRLADDEAFYRRRAMERGYPPRVVDLCLQRALVEWAAEDTRETLELLRMRPRIGFANLVLSLN